MLTQNNGNKMGLLTNVFAYITLKTCNILITNFLLTVNRFVFADGSSDSVYIFILTSCAVLTKSTQKRNDVEIEQIHDCKRMLKIYTDNEHTCKYGCSCSNRKYEPKYKYRN